MEYTYPKLLSSIFSIINNSFISINEYSKMLGKSNILKALTNLSSNRNMKCKMDISFYYFLYVINRRNKIRAVLEKIQH